MYKEAKNEVYNFATKCKKKYQVITEDDSIFIKCKVGVSKKGSFFENFENFKNVE